MERDLCINCHHCIPQHVRDEFDEDEICALKPEINFEYLLGKDNCRQWNFEALYSFLKKRLVFVSPDSVIRAFCDPPSQHQYSVDVMFSFPTTGTNKTIHVSGVDADSTSPAVSFLLEFILVCQETKDCNDIGKNVGVVYKSFPTYPRQSFGSLDISIPKGLFSRKRKISDLTQSSFSKNSTASTVDIEFRFLALKKAHCEALFRNTSSLFLSSIKFSQCEIEEWPVQSMTRALEESSDEHARAPLKLVLSCTQQEFHKVPAGNSLVPNKISGIGELHLILHFILSELDLDHLISMIKMNQNLESLSIEYLDLSDTAWARVCQSLHNHTKLKYLNLAYTEKFADSYRRLTPQRRTIRTKDILELLQRNKIIHEIDWPKFQQDETLIGEIERILTENKESG